MNLRFNYLLYSPEEHFVPKLFQISEIVPQSRYSKEHGFF
jgi:hypothetical protein